MALAGAGRQDDDEVHQNFYKPLLDEKLHTEQTLYHLGKVDILHS